jgi:C-terminal processing protease CtpA/Prc
MKAFGVFALLCICPGTMSSQQNQPLYRTGMTIIRSSSTSCPVFVGDVSKDSPAAKAGIKSGDQLIAVDGMAVTSLQVATEHLSAKTASPVTIELKRDEKPYGVTVQREENHVLWSKSGLKLTEDGLLVDINATDAEIEYYRSTLRALQHAEDRITIFPGHYPGNKQLYYPGFEVFVWDNKNQVTVGGIEQGPASRAGIRWGDRILNVKGVDPRGRSVAELESLFSSPKPATMVLTIERAGQQKKYSIKLEQAAEVLRENQWQVINDKLVPIWAPQKYLSCFK